jgi:hypothetical protein
MHKEEYCDTVRARLDSHGLPADVIERNVAELSDHWDDIVQAAVEQPSDGKMDAAATLGLPEEVAAQIISARKESSWAGRHPIILLSILPFLAAPLLMAGLLLPGFFLNQTFQWVRLETLTPPLAAAVNVILSFLGYATIAAGSYLICFLIWRAGLGRRWLIGAWAWCALICLLRTMEANLVEHRALVGLRFPWRFDSQMWLILFLHLLVIWRFFDGFGRRPAPDRGASTAS